MSYDPDRTADIYAEVESAPAKKKQKQLTSDQERLAFARQKHVALTKSSNSGRYGFNHHENYYLDFARPETSHWDFSNVCYLLNLLEEPTFQGLWFRLEDGHYDTKLAQWNLVRATPMKFPQGVATPPNFATLAELKVALTARIKELQIDEVKLAEWMSVAHSIADDQAFCRLPFSEKMETFRQGESL